MKKFTVTKEHIKLLRHAYVSWNDTEFGAPSIDGKRPYGNGDVVADIVEILGTKSPYDQDGELVDQKLWEQLRMLHQETEIALQIFLSTGKMEEGKYQADDYSINWTLVK